MENKAKEFGQFVRETIDFYLKCYAFLVKASKKYWYLIFVAVLAVVAIWSKGYIQAEKSYKGSMVCTYNYMGKKMYGVLLGQLNTDIQDENFESLERSLKVSPETAQSFISIKSFDENHNELYETIEEVHGPIYIEVELSDNKNVDAIQEGIINYINNYPFVLKTISKYRLETEEKIAFLNKEIVLIDSLKKNANQKKTSVEKNAKVDVTDYFKLSEKKFKEKMSLVNTLSNVYAVEVFAPLKISQSQVKSNRKSNLLISVLVLFLSVFISALLFWYKNPDSFEE